jgi:hypothetical protein
MNPSLQNEEQKRERSWSAQERWRLIQEAIAWAETQATVRRNTPQSRLAEQSRKIAFTDKSAGTTLRQSGARYPAR